MYVGRIVPAEGGGGGGGGEEMRDDENGRIGK